MKLKLTFLLFSLLLSTSLATLLQGQAIRQTNTEFYISKLTHTAQQNFATYSAQVIDKQEALKKERIIPNDIARNHLILKEVKKTTDSADLRIYLFVGDYQFLKVQPYSKKEKMPTNGLEINMYYKEVHYQLPVYAHAYDCSGKLIWTAQAPQNKVFFFGVGFTNEQELDAAWNKNSANINRLAINDGLIGQAKLWMEDIQKTLIPEKTKQLVSFLKPKKLEDYQEFRENIFLSEKILKNLHTHNSHEAAIKAAQTAITAWKSILPTLEKEEKKYYAAALYNLALLYYKLDQLTEANQYALTAMATGELKNFNKYLLRNIEKANQAFKKSGTSSSNVYTRCTGFMPIDPSSIDPTLEVNPTIHSIEVLTSTTSPPPSVETSTPMDISVDDIKNWMQKDNKFKRNKPLEDGMVFLNKGQLLQGQIKGDLSSHKILKKGILFAPFKEDGSVGRERKLKPSELKKFVHKGKTYESHIAGTKLFKLIGERYFMEVLEDGQIQLLHFRYRKRTIMGMWLIPFSREKILIKIPSKNRAQPLKKINMNQLLNDAPPILEKYKAGAYGSKVGKKNLRIGFIEFTGKDSGIRAIIRDYNAYMYKQSDKANTGGFKMN